MFKDIRILSAPEPAVTSAGKRKYRLERDYIGIVIIGNTILKIIVRKGFVYDGASIPWLAWTLLRLHPGGIMLLSSLWHDILYMTAGGRIKIKNATVIINREAYITREESDDILGALALYNDVKERKVRFIGWIFTTFGRPIEKKHWGRGDS